MARLNKIIGVHTCPQCKFRFRARVETYMHASPFARKVMKGVLLVLFPTLLAIAIFFALFRDDKGRVIHFDGIENFIMLMMFTPSLLLYGWYLLIPKQMTYRCPQCSWSVTYVAKDGPPQTVMRPTEQSDPPST